MTLKEQLDNAMKQAMKARDDLRLSAVRMIRSAVKNREIDQQSDQVISILTLRNG